MMNRSLLLLVLVMATGADWPQFRGTGSASLSTADGLPTKWDGTTGENIAWKVDIPGRAVSGPIVVQGRVIVTSSSGATQDKLHAACYDEATGKPVWTRQFWATGRTLCHPASAVAANTPASDGQRIYAFFSSNDLVCLDLDGNLLWYRGLTYDHPNAANDVGMSSSPLVTPQAVIVQVENKTDSFAAALDKQTGATLWKIPRFAEMNWTSPISMTAAGGESVVLLQSTNGLTAHDPTTGRQLWAHEKKCSGIPSSLAVGGTVFVPSEGLTALRPASTGSQAEVLWSTTKLEPGNASPVVRDNLVYIVNRAGALTCGDTGTGEVQWRSRVKGPVWATPVLAGRSLYVTNQDGVTYVAAVDEKGEIVAENPLGEEVYGSPAVGNRAIYLRSVGRLWKVANQP